VLGVGRKTAKAIAQEADAVVRVNGRKLNSMEKIRQYIDTVAGK
jgi:ribosomal protein S13